MIVKEYEEMFADYFNKIEYRGVPIRPGPSTLGGDVNVHNCIGDPPKDCPKGFYCIGSTRQWACL